MTRRLSVEPWSLDRIDELFTSFPNSRLAAAGEAVLDGLEDGIDTFRELEADGEPFHVPDEVKYQDLRTVPGGLVRISAAEGQGEPSHPTWAIVFLRQEDGARVHVQFAGPRSEYTDT